MPRQAFLDWLIREVRSGKMGEDEAAAFLRRFDAGERFENAPLPEVDYKRAVALAATIAIMFMHRVRAVELLQDKFHDDAINLAVLPILAWQSGMAELIAVNVIAGAMIGRGGTRVDVASLEPPISRQLAFLGRFSDERALAAVRGRPLSPAAIAARSRLYAGEGRAAYFDGFLSGLPTGASVDYISSDDLSTCAPCLSADHGGPYSIDNVPLPGSICLGGGLCRCTLEVR